MTPEIIKLLVTNPFYCLARINESLVDEHEPMITEDEFVQMGTKLISEIGPEEYIRCLLNNLKGNFVANDDVEIRMT